MYDIVLLISLLNVKLFSEKLTMVKMKCIVCAPRSGLTKRH